MPTLQSVLLRRARIVHVDHEPATARGFRPRSARKADSGLTALEAELLDRGYALTEPLRGALAAAGAEALGEAGRRLLREIDELLGADRTHMPLFGGFPGSVPRDTDALYVDRVFALLLQEPEQPCVLCGTAGRVRPVSPCAHLVCGSCWDGAGYNGCPICHRRIDRAAPFLRPVPPGDHDVPRTGTPGGPLRLLRLGSSRTADAAAELTALLARRTPLSPQDRADLAVLVAHAPDGLGWLPADVPVREAKALVLGALLRDARTAEAARRRLPELLTTATDVLRLLCVWSGGDPDPRGAPRMRSVPRGLRRALLAVLDGLDVPALVEDVHRHPRAWKRAGEVLHPYERHARHPRAALAFATLRATETSATGDLGEALLRTAAAYPEAVTVRAGTARTARPTTVPVRVGLRGLYDRGPVRRSVPRVRIVARTWAARAEEALRGDDPAAALRLLGERPGELVRRLDHLLRRYGAGLPAEELGRVLRRGLPSVGPGPLLSALGELRGRHLAGERRVFFPRGRVSRPFRADDDRAPLPGGTVAEVCALLEAEVLRRLGKESRFDLAVLDSGLAGIPVPFAERSTASSLVEVPRGGFFPLPEGEVLRLFLHWTEPAGTRVDLDLSVVFFDEEWRFTGLCDYTSLRRRDDAAVHSGDLTSAPAPDGATEYVDLDPAGLAAAGVRYAVPVVLSFNSIPFEALPDAFAGYMALPDRRARDASYDPRAVRQRFDLTGYSRICVPMVVDLADGRALWTDVHLPGDEGFHSAGRHTERLGRLGLGLWEYFTGGARVSLWDLACWHAAARADEVVVVGRAPDEVRAFRRRADEEVAAFAARLRGPGAAGERWRAGGPGEAAGRAAHAADGRRVLLALREGDIAPEKATGVAYRLFPGPVDGCEDVARVTAGDLLAALS
ncbi:MXAN_6230/SCO0854 family RING domain-containing protein [Streptomyces albireticuli]|uniref:MXAN_6230/SCO0854 family RING domain-containing protein n=1 Tax=Streptomyces albireticuli TaxID=1940 RepID=UPI0036CB0413